MAFLSQTIVILPFTPDQPIEKAHTEISVNICQYLSISPEVVG
jgi:hypothetical protein